MVSRLLFAGLLLLADNALAQAPDLQPEPDHADTGTAALSKSAAAAPGPGLLPPSAPPLPEAPAPSSSFPALEAGFDECPPRPAVRLWPFGRAPPHTS